MFKIPGTAKIKSIIAAIVWGAIASIIPSAATAEMETEGDPNQTTETETEAAGFTGLDDPILLALAISARTDLLNGNTVATLAALIVIIDGLRASK